MTVFAQGDLPEGYHHPLCPFHKGGECQCELIDQAYSEKAAARQCEHPHCIVEARFCQPHAEEHYQKQLAAEQAAEQPSP